VPPDLVASIARRISEGKCEEIALSTPTANPTGPTKAYSSPCGARPSELGANGIILDAINEAGAGAKVAAAIFGTGTQRKGRSIAIFVFPDSSGSSTR
jgi:hypothetical protein